MTERTIDALWQDYLFLTKELGKAVTRQDMDLFFALLSQRHTLQTMIEQHGEQPQYSHSSSGQSILMIVQQENQRVRLLLHAGMNRLRSRDKVNRAYEAFGNSGTSGWMDFRK